MPTAEQEAWEANFQKDIEEKLIKQVINFLAANFSRDSKFVPLDTGFNFIMPAAGTFIINFLRDTDNPKVIWQIRVLGRHWSGHGYGPPLFSFTIPISHQEGYTKKEFERAINSIKVRLLESIQKIK